MSYPAIISHRIPYDLDGTLVGYSGTGTTNYSVATFFNMGINSWLTEAQRVALNSLQTSTIWGVGSYNSNTPRTNFWFFFPERILLKAVGFHLVQPTSYDKILVMHDIVVEGSNDTTNGVDGTWFSLSIPNAIANAIDQIPGERNTWRADILQVTMPIGFRCIRLSLSRKQNGDSGSSVRIAIGGVHLYGESTEKYADDIRILDADMPDDPEFIAVKDWGNIAEGFIGLASFKVKNQSPDKVASIVNLQLNDAEYGLSFSSEGPWSTFLNISEVALGEKSQTIYMRNIQPDPPTLLNPKYARLIVNVDEWLEQGGV